MRLFDSRSSQRLFHEGILILLVMIIAIGSANISKAQTIDSISIKPTVGGVLVINDKAICLATTTPTSGVPLSFRFSRVTTNNLRFDDIGGTSNTYDCSGKCALGDRVQCSAYASATPPPAPCPSEQICSLDAYLYCSGTTPSNPSSKTSPYLTVSDQCGFTLSERTGGNPVATHDIACMRANIEDVTSKFIMRECKGAGDPIVAENRLEHGSATPIGAVYYASMQSSDGPKTKVNSETIINPKEGAIFANLTTTWAGNDGSSHRIAHYYKDDNNQIILEKGSDNNIACIYKVAGTEIVTKVPATQWQQGFHKVLMQWNATLPNGYLNCSTDENTPSIVALTTPIAGVPTAGPGGYGSTGDLVIGAEINGGMTLSSKLSITFWKTPFPTITYCANDGKLSSTLDKKAPASCINAGLKWTGVACCGEYNQKPEYYNDPMLPLDENRNIDWARVVCKPGEKICDQKNITKCTFNFNYTLSSECPNACQLSDNEPQCAIGTPTPRPTPRTYGPADYPYSTATQGTCWNSTYAQNGLPIPNTQNKVLSAYGRLLGCGIESTSQLLSMKDSKIDLPLIQLVPSCSIAKKINDDPAFNLYCSYKDQKWVLTSEPMSMQLSTSPTNQNDKECCPISSCWNGAECKPDQTLDPRPTGGDRCISGQWIKSQIKYSWDRAMVGYCPQSTQCLVNPGANPQLNGQPQKYFGATNTLQQPACINNGQYILEHYCKDGNWTSRSEALSLELLSKADQRSKGAFAIFCGNYSEVLNFIQYESVGGQTVEQYLKRKCTINNEDVPCANNFCVMKYGDNKVAFATSLNTPPDDETNSFVQNALGLTRTACNIAAIDNGQFQQCTSGVNAVSVFYSLALNSIISIPTADTTSASSTQAIPTPTIPAQLNRDYENIYHAGTKEVFSYADQNQARKAAIKYLENSTTMSNTYILNDTGRFYFAFLEKDIFYDQYFDVAALAYDGLTFNDPIGGNDACTMINAQLDPTQYSVALGERLDCTYDVTNRKLRMISISRSQRSTMPQIRKIWPDLTAKLR